MTLELGDDASELAPERQVAGHGREVAGLELIVEVAGDGAGKTVDDEGRTRARRHAVPVRQADRWQPLDQRVDGEIRDRGRRRDRGVRLDTRNEQCLARRSTRGGRASHDLGVAVRWTRFRTFVNTGSLADAYRRAQASSSTFPRSRCTDVPGGWGCMPSRRNRALHSWSEVRLFRRAGPEPTGDGDRRLRATADPVEPEGRDVDAVAGSQSERGGDIR